MSAAECGRAGGVLDSVVRRASDAGVLRSDFGADDLATLVWGDVEGHRDVWR